MIAMPFHPSNAYAIDEVNSNLKDVLHEVEERARVSFGGRVDVDLTKIIRGSSLTEEGRLIDANGDEIDRRRTRIQVSISPQDISMTDDIQEGIVDGYISNLIYKGDHYSYVIHTDLEQDFVVDDEYLWNMDDHVGLIMPISKMTFSVKR